MFETMHYCDGARNTKTDLLSVPASLPTTVRKWSEVELLKMHIMTIHINTDNEHYNEVQKGVKRNTARLNTQIINQISNHTSLARIST